jgi:hypothetical protein
LKIDVLLTPHLSHRLANARGSAGQPVEISAAVDHPAELRALAVVLFRRHSHSPLQLIQQDDFETVQLLKANAAHAGVESILINDIMQVLLGEHRAHQNDTVDIHGHDPKVGRGPQAVNIDERNREGRIEMRKIPQALHVIVEADGRGLR